MANPPNAGAAETEGVIKFDLEFELCDLEIESGNCEALNTWRDKLAVVALIGADKDRYGGLGFGNLSCRTDAGFLITGSQTGLLTTLSRADYAEVMQVDITNNKIHARGLRQPSSESLTHAAVYDRDKNINYVFHVHSPDIWRNAMAIGLQVTDSRIAYGTTAMAAEMRTVVTSSTGIFAMGGHKDGVMAYGKEATEVGELMLTTLARCT